MDYSDLNFGVVVHELAHKWDHGHDWELSEGLKSATGGKTTWWGGYKPGGKAPPGGGGKKEEDFAYSVQAYFTGGELDSGRNEYIEALFVSH